MRAVESTAIGFRAGIFRFYHQITFHGAGQSRTVLGDHLAEVPVPDQFDSFEAARERIKLWIKYYNHKRPHQGIEELCPADRFAELVKSFLQHNTSFAFITLKAKGGFIDEMIIITLYGHKIAGL